MRTLFLFVAVIFVTSCEKIDLVTMIYAETQCSDVWMTYKTTDNTTEEAVIQYFEETHNIELIEVSVEMVNNGIFCQACTCPSGREIEVNVEEKFVNTMEAEGFNRE